MWQFWLIVSGVFLITEILTTGFFIFGLCFSALITMCVSFFTDNIFVQAIVFIVFSVILILVTKPFVHKFIHKNVKTTKTNAFSIIGKKAIVIEDIDSINGSGQIKVNGEIWSAEDLNNSNIEKGSEVEINKIVGVKAIVSKLK